MTHFRGQIRGPHWGPTMDTMLIDFWRRHECLFNSSVDSYYDKDLKAKLWAEFALSIGKPVSDVERRSRSLRTQYGRVLWHPEKVSTVQQKKLREKLDFLRPYIVRRRGDFCLDETFVDQGEDDDELETEGSTDQEMGSLFWSTLDADVTGEDLDDESRSVASAQLHCPNPRTQCTEVMSLSCPRCHDEEGRPHQHAAAPSTSKHDTLNQFTEVMLADMRQIQDPMVLMRLRRDITDLVFKAVEEDVQGRCIRAPPTPVVEDSAQSRSSPRRPHSQTDVSLRQRFVRRMNTGCEAGRRVQRWEDVKHIRRVSRSQSSQASQHGQVVERMSGNGSHFTVQTFEIKRETEPHTVKLEEEPLPLA
ncbi:uncharacterized protein LOC125017461 [Mugil cephalus]|uniref:uncharacterized protein LOC125017461 n=1 Tax=Mugil cephalus TaxID=48193 RepID=UPI001FB8003D|nr:uncharacterized protein LOC125017461 [Mugil cephalus]XP_047456650.1 uncharacterized protein LOC125017461 [Mugil cephalus]